MNQFTINGVLIASSNYNEYKKHYEFYDIHSRLVATISSKRLRLPKDNNKAWGKIADLFGDMPKGE
jgi:hypothetical protein